ncbi:hypothetical protein KY289_030672 [Solanum tuberosum]|nr:hypothetical protein KY289_030672 [Solanum tuberosum]
MAHQGTITSRGIGVIIIGPIIRCSPQAKLRGAPNKHQLQGTPPQILCPSSTSPRSLSLLG